MLYRSGCDLAAFAPSPGGNYKRYEIAEIVDRVGVGASFGAALRYCIERNFIFISCTEIEVLAGGIRPGPPVDHRAALLIGSLCGRLATTRGVTTAPSQRQRFSSPVSNRSRFGDRRFWIQKSNDSCKAQVDK